MDIITAPATYKNAIQKYATTHHTINKTRQIVMLYEAAIRYTQIGRESIINKDIQERYNNIEKASNIITGLQNCLDFEQGGEIAKLLDSFYFSIFMRLMNIQMDNDLALCDSVIKELNMMKEAWEEVDQTASGTPSYDNGSAIDSFNLDV
jgi:flagellar protein FliS